MALSVNLRNDGHHRAMSKGQTLLLEVDLIDEGACVSAGALLDAGLVSSLLRHCTHSHLTFCASLIKPCDRGDLDNEHWDNAGLAPHAARSLIVGCCHFFKQH